MAKGRRFRVSGEGLRKTKMLNLKPYTLYLIP